MIDLIALTEKEKQLLMLLAKGDSGREVAEAMGLREGTTRVYLHALYKRIGVPSKARAVRWYLDQIGDKRGAAADDTAHVQIPATFGEMAVASTLFSAMGFTQIYFGGYGKMWEVGLRLRGERVNTELARRQRQSRQLWEALLKGDFLFAKQRADMRIANGATPDTHDDAVVMTLLLTLGGYSKLAERELKAVNGTRQIPAQEKTLLRVVSDLTDRAPKEALAGLTKIASDSTAQKPFRHLALTALYHIYLLRRDIAPAVAVANAIANEIEMIRQNLGSVGESPMYGDGTIPASVPTSVESLNRYMEKVRA
jgi:DNA-binding CsgD family transcriptional regulator